MSHHRSPVDPSPPERLVPLLLPPVEEPSPRRGRLFWTAMGLILLLAFILTSLFPQGFPFAWPAALPAGAPSWARDAQRAIALIATETSQGTGFNVAPQGLFVTAAHVAQWCESCSVTVLWGPRYRGTVMAEDDVLDVALLDLKGKPLLAPGTLPALPLRASSEDLQPGDTIWVLGNPEDQLGVLTEGRFRGVYPDPRHGNVLILFVPVQHGHSGSPVLDEEGRVVGMVIALGIIEELETQVQVGVALPVEALWDILEKAPHE
ncbi:MAG: serine protease [Clostridiales bacterium]|nr:serine protease [Clostridiales bacterium]